MDVVRWKPSLTSLKIKNYKSFLKFSSSTLIPLLQSKINLKGVWLLPDRSVLALRGKVKIGQKMCRKKYVTKKILQIPKIRKRGWVDPTLYVNVWNSYYSIDVIPKACFDQPVGSVEIHILGFVLPVRCHHGRKHSKMGDSIILYIGILYIMHGPIQGGGANGTVLPPQILKELKKKGSNIHI